MHLKINYFIPSPTVALNIAKEEVEISKHVLLTQNDHGKSTVVQPKPGLLNPGSEIPIFLTDVLCRTLESSLFRQVKGYQSNISIAKETGDRAKSE